jgi:3-methyladenine DNA glycosylase Mpg
MTTSEQGAIEMAAGHVYLYSCYGARYQLDQQAGGASHLLLKEIFMGLVQLTQDWL